MSYASLRILRADGRRQLDNVVRHGQENSHETSNGARDTGHELHGACVSARTRLINASSSSSEWKCVACPETTCSTRPSQASGSPGGWARSCTTKARLVGSGSGNWGMGDLLHHPIQAGHFHVVHGLPGREQLKRLLHVLAQEDTRHYLFKTIPPSVQMWGCGAPEAFKDCSSYSGWRCDALRLRTIAVDRLRQLQPDELRHHHRNIELPEHHLEPGQRVYQYARRCDVAVPHGRQSHDTEVIEEIALQVPVSTPPGDRVHDPKRLGRS